MERISNDIKKPSSKVDYSVGENIYMLPSNMNLNIKSGTVGYNNKILVSDNGFSLEKGDKVNNFEIIKINHKAAVQKPTITHKKQKPTNTQTINHNEEENFF